jgi:dehydrogenase/reductase SDR family protein 12
MNPADVIDDLLELSVVGSFSRLGYRARRSLYGWSSPPAGALRSATALVTGPTSGLGRAATEGLAALGARVILVGRDRGRLGSVRDELVDGYGEDRFPIVMADMSSLASVRAAVRELLARESRLHVLVDNAGAIHPRRTVTAEGMEATFATMVAGPFVLIDGLLPLLEASGDGRVISVTSGGMYAQALPLDDLQYEHGAYDGTRAYARAKRASVALIREWSRRYRGHVTFDAMHPGWSDTPGLARSLPTFYRLMRPILRGPAEGVDTILWLASVSSAGRTDGQLYLDRRPRPFDRLPGTRLSGGDRRRLWDLMVELVDLRDGRDEPAQRRPGAA